MPPYCSGQGRASQRFSPSFLDAIGQHDVADRKLISREIGDLYLTPLNGHGRSAGGFEFRGDGRIKCAGFPQNMRGSERGMAAQHHLGPAGTRTVDEPHRPDRDALACLAYPARRTVFINDEVTAGIRAAYNLLHREVFGELNQKQKSAIVCRLIALGRITWSWFESQSDEDAYRLLDDNRWLLKRLP